MRLWRLRLPRVLRVSRKDGWKHYESNDALHLIPSDPIDRSQEEHALVLQAWLFFGMLAEVLAISGVEMKIADLCIRAAAGLASHNHGTSTGLLGSMVRERESLFGGNSTRTYFEI
jgi:hypothetical protein